MGTDPSCLEHVFLSIKKTVLLFLHPYLYPADVGAHSEPGRPAQGVQNVTLTPLRRDHCQLVDVILGRWQDAQDAPQNKEIVLERAGLLK